MEDLIRKINGAIGYYNKCLSYSKLTADECKWVLEKLDECYALLRAIKG